MTVSGSTDFELDVSDYIEEAFERCGLEVRTGYDLKTAKRSLNLMLGDWANRGLNQWTIDQTTIALTRGNVCNIRTGCIYHRCAGCGHTEKMARILRWRAY